MSPYKRKPKPKRRHEPVPIGRPPKDPTLGIHQGTPKATARDPQLKPWSERAKTRERNREKWHSWLDSMPDHIREPYLMARAERDRLRRRRASDDNEPA